MDKELLAKIKHVCLDRPVDARMSLYKNIGASSINNSNWDMFFFHLPDGEPPAKHLTFTRSKRRQNSGDQNTQYFLGQFPKTAEDWERVRLEDANDPWLRREIPRYDFKGGIPRGQFTFKPVIDSIIHEPKKGEAGYKTPKDQQKLRNACFSGHMAGEELKCPMCQKARFNALVAGYHGDTPTVEEVAKYLIAGIQPHAFTSSWQLRGFEAVCRWLKLPENPSEDDISKFVVRTRAIDLLHSWAKGTGSNYFIEHPITHEHVTLAPLHPVGKSNLMAHIIGSNPVLADIYREGMVMAFDIETNMTGEDYLSSLAEKIKPAKPLPDSLDALSRLYTRFGDIHRSTARRPGRRRGILNAVIAQALARMFGDEKHNIAAEHVLHSPPRRPYYVGRRDRQEKVDDTPPPQASLLARALLNRLK